MDTNNYVDVPASYLEDDSFTISYSLDTGFWSCFHDYVGNFRFATRNQSVYSFHDNAIWLHNQENYGKYYGNDTKKSYITPTYNPQLKEEDRRYAFITNSINYVCSFYAKEGNFNQRLPYKTFSTLSVHNSYQSTSELVLKTIDDTCNLKEVWQSINIRFNRNGWFFTKIYDETNLHNVATLTEKFDEIVNNVVQVTCGKRKRTFVDDFLIVKLTYDNIDQCQMVFSEILFDISPLRV